ncbi:hypothetical protein [Nocardioides coralli]|uniref:hypothetical protein n=1 Tax=Nocardioides coralli TaxID=2872154 RepID=UPI001CA3FDE7|nr:hypothetical protein [Nocardioides coralli]QZY30291.1 hypothetical protein K6T13_06390 [Nocardioides coralli]
MHLPARLTGLFLAATLVLSGCSGDDEAPAAEEPTETTTAETEEEPYLEVPDGVELTAQGSTLEVGDTATVAYEPRQDQVGALEVKVTSLEKASFDQFVGWELSKQTRQTSPYFVRANVTNVGDSNLGGRPVPLYIVDGENRLIEASVFTGTFKPCDGASFPKKFKSGASVKACLVYLAPDKGDLTAVSFRPTQEFNPITWEGELKPAKGSGQDKKQGKGKDKGKGGSGGG